MIYPACVSRYGHFRVAWGQIPSRAARDPRLWPRHFVLDVGGVPVSFALLLPSVAGPVCHALESLILATPEGEDDSISHVFAALDELEFMRSSCYSSGQASAYLAHSISPPPLPAIPADRSPGPFSAEVGFPLRPACFTGEVLIPFPCTPSTRS